MKTLTILLVTLIISGCATNFTTRTEGDGTKTTQRTLTSWGMANHAGNETVIVGENLEMRSGVEHEGKITPEEAAFLLNLIAPMTP